MEEKFTFHNTTGIIKCDECKKKITYAQQYYFQCPLDKSNYHKSCVDCSTSWFEIDEEAKFVARKEMDKT